MKDLSDRLHICMSSNYRNEVNSDRFLNQLLYHPLTSIVMFCYVVVSWLQVVVGCSDHALYSVDVSNDKKRPITMYSKKYGKFEVYYLRCSLLHSTDIWGVADCIVSCFYLLLWLYRSH